MKSRTSSPASEGRVAARPSRPGYIVRKHLHRSCRPAAIVVFPKVAMEGSRQGRSPAGPHGSRAEARRLTAGAPATSGVARAGSPDSASRIILYNRHVISFASIPREPGRAPIDGGHESRWREAIASWPDRTQAESGRGDRGGRAAAMGARSPPRKQSWSTAQSKRPRCNNHAE
jgi:hypothetical protein